MMIIFLLLKNVCMSTSVKMRSGFDTGRSEVYSSISYKVTPTCRYVPTHAVRVYCASIISHVSCQ